MMDIEVVVDIGAPFEEALDMLGDFGLISDFHPQIASCLVEGEGVGAIRRCTLSDGSSMVERLAEDPADGYSTVMIEGPGGLARLETSMRVEPREGGCRGVARARFEPTPDADAGELEATLRGILETGLESAKRMLEG